MSSVRFNPTSSARFVLYDDASKQDDVEQQMLGLDDVNIQSLQQTDNSLKDLAEVAVLATEDENKISALSLGKNVFIDNGRAIDPVDEPLRNSAALFEQALANTDLASLTNPTHIRVQEINNEGVFTKQYILLVDPPQNTS